MNAPSIAQIQYAVCERAGIPLAEMSSHRQGRAVARPRQIAMYLARELTPLSLPVIGRHFGGRDHTTVMWAIQVVAQRMAADAGLASFVAEITDALMPPDDPRQMALPLATFGDRL